MKGLLIKDFYTLVKQMKLFLVMIGLFAVIPGSSMSSFAVIYAAMLPMTALAYDERAKWDELAAMLPYSEKALVFSKYALGYAGIFLSSLLSLGAQVALSLIRREPMVSESLLMLPLLAVLGLVMEAVSLPLLFRFGVEKGRYMLLFIIGGLAALGVGLGGDLAVYLSKGEGMGILLLALALAAFLNFLSVHISTAAYRRWRR